MNDKSKDLAKTDKPKNAIQLLASKLNVSEQGIITMLRKTAFKECKTDEEFMAAVIIANTYGLNPLLKEIYAFPGSRGGVVPVVGVDGWIKIVNRKPNFDGCELIENYDDDGKFISVTAKFYLKDRSHPLIITEYLDECKKATEPWKKWEKRMLRHKAYIQGARVAFGISGIYDEDEAARIIEAQEIDDPKANVSMPKEKPQDQAPDTSDEGSGAITEEIPFPDTKTKPEPEPKPETETPKPAESKYPLMLKSFTEAKKVLGDKTYYEILGNFGLKHANSIRTLAQGNQILDRMRSEAK